jgi:hypothetical protein
VIDCEQCERPFEPVFSRWLCPYCKWKADCCTGEPLPESGPALFVKTPEMMESKDSTTTT